MAPPKRTSDLLGRRIAGRTGAPSSTRTHLGAAKTTCVGSAPDPLVMVFGPAPFLKLGDLCRSGGRGAGRPGRRGVRLGGLLGQEGRLRVRLLAVLAIALGPGVSLTDRDAALGDRRAHSKELPECRVALADRAVGLHGEPERGREPLEKVACGDPRLDLLSQGVRRPGGQQPAQCGPLERGAQRLLDHGLGGDRLAEDLGVVGEALQLGLDLGNEGELLLSRKLSAEIGRWHRHGVGGDRRQGDGRRGFDEGHG